MNPRLKIKLLVSLLLTALTINTQPTYAASTKNLKNLYLNVTYPPVVKMPKGNCGSFSIKYKLGLRAINYGFGYSIVSVLVDSDTAAGVYFAYGEDMIDNYPEEGTFKLKFSKNDWMDGSDPRIGISPGTYTIGMLTYFDDKVFKESTIRFVK